VPVPSQDKLGELRQKGHLAENGGVMEVGPGGTDSPDGVASRQIVRASASVVFPCTIKSRRWRAIMEEVDKGCKEFCVSVGTVTRTDGILIHSLRCLLCVSAVLSVLCHIQFIQQQFVTYCSLWTTQHLVST